MTVTMLRVKLKPERVAELEDAVKTMFVHASLSDSAFLVGCDLEGTASSECARPAWRSRMIVPRTPDASSPGPRAQTHSHRRAAAAAGRFSPPATRGEAASGFPRGQRLAGPGRPAQPPWRHTRRRRGRARPYVGWLRLARPLGRRPHAAGALTSRAAAPLMKRRRISSATLGSPRAKARSRAMASRGRLSPRAAASKTPGTSSAQSAAHTATTRRSASLSVCGDPREGCGSVSIRLVYGASSNQTTASS
jgi:hypothetical protein